MRYLLLLAFVPTGILFAAVLREGNITFRETISWHIAQSSRLILLGRLSIPLISVFVASWFFRYSQGSGLGIVPLVLMTIVCITAAILGLVPYIVGTRTGAIHNAVSWIYVFALPVLLLSWAWYEHGASQVVLLVCGLAQVGLIALALNKKAWSYFFIFEGVYILLFGLALLGVAYGAE